MAMIMKWALAILAVLGGFLLAGISGKVLTELAGFWGLPGAGFSAAFAVVLVTYLAAPSHKLLSSAIALILGAVAAWLVLEPSFYPESYGEQGAYQPTHLPIIATYVGGILGSIVAAALMRWTRPNSSFKADGCAAA
jgi:hypothetical protein